VDKQIQAAAEYQRSLRRQRRRRYICFIGFIVLAVLFTVSLVAYTIVAGVDAKIPDAGKDNSAMTTGYTNLIRRVRVRGRGSLKAHLDRLRNNRMSPRQSRWRQRIVFWKRNAYNPEAEPETSITTAATAATAATATSTSAAQSRKAHFIPTRTTFAVKKAVHTPLQVV
jgi:hypothetical protein